MNEMVYSGNLGFEEMVKFYKVASPSQIKKMEMFIKKSDWKSFKKLINDVLGVKLEHLVSRIDLLLGE